MHKCKNCGTEFESSFCPNCGTPAEEQQSEAIQREIEQFGFNKIWKKYSRVNIVSIPIKLISGLLAAIMIVIYVCVCIDEEQIILNIVPGLAVFFCVADKYICSIVEINSKVKFAHIKEIDFKSLLLKENVNITINKEINVIRAVAYYHNNFNVFKKHNVIDIFIYIFNLIAGEVSVYLILLYGTNNFKGQLVLPLILLTLPMILMVTMLIIRFNIGRKRKNSISDWAKQYLS